MTRNRLILGLTGGSGAGKGEVARILAGLGAEIICADSVAHHVMKKGETPAFDGIVREFGEGVIGADGEICRKKLREIVFVDKDQLKNLERIVHSVIVDMILKAANASTKRVVVIDAPLLVPSGLHKECDHTIGVFAPLDVRTSRICQRDGLSVADAQIRINNQMSDDELRKVMDFEIDNSGTLEELDGKVRKIFDIIIAGIGA
ncbi:MAG: dephospho-CoA kinase [Defluviitaleaceae bacterium]|nr:dephospho-CoA kinase [Defluviitaleaceae bacterium]